MIVPAIINNIHISISITYSWQTLVMYGLTTFENYNRKIVKIWYDKPQQYIEEDTEDTNRLLGSRRKGSARQRPRFVV